MGAKNVKKKGRPCKPSFCKNCQEEFPNALIKGLHTINDCARNRQKKKGELEKQKSEDVQKFENPGHVAEIQSHVKASRVPIVLDEARQTRNRKRSKPAKKVPNVRSRKKTRKKKSRSDSDINEFSNEEKTSDLDSPIVKKKCLNRPEELEMVNKNATTKLTQSTKVKSEKEIFVQEAENSGGDSSSVIETLGELVAEANNNIKKSEESEDLDLDSKLRSVDIFPLEVCITEHVTVAVEDNILIENETEVRNGGHIEEIMATKGEESNNQGKSTVDGTINKDKQNKRKLKKERRKQWEIRRELRIRGDSKATIEKEIGKRISQWSNSNKMNTISSHDLNLKIEKIDEDDSRKAALKARSSKSVNRNSKSKTTSNDSQTENDHHDSEKAVVKTTVKKFVETSKNICGLTRAENRVSETSSQIRPPGTTKTSTARSLASSPYDTLQLAPSLCETIPLSASARKTNPLGASKSDNMLLASSPRKTIPLAEQLKLTDESDSNEIGEAERKLKSWVARDDAHSNAGENINTKRISTTVTQSYGGGGGSKEDKVVTNINNIFTEKVSDKNSAKYEMTEKRLNSAVFFGSPKKISPTMNTSKDSIDDPVMNCEDSDELNISYDGPKFSDEEEAQDGEFSDDPVEEGCQPLASSDKTKHSPSLASPTVTSTSRGTSHKDPSVKQENKDLNENRRTLKNENLGGKFNDKANEFLPSKVTEERAVTMKPDDFEEEDDEIELDVSYTMFDDEEESSGHDKDNIKKVDPRNDNVSSKVKTEKNKEVRKFRDRIQEREKENTVSALDYVVPQERNNDDTEEKKETARRKTVEERRRNFEQEQLQRRGNYCLSLVKCVPCVTEGCSWVHVFDPQAALDHFYSLYHNTDQEDPSRRLLFFWKFHAMKSVPAGRAVLSAISDLASKGKLKIDTRGFSQLVDFLQSFPDFYTMSLEPGRLVMENLLEAFMSALEEEEHRGRKTEIETFFAFAWNRIYLSSLRHGLVLKQKTLESICSLAENLHWYCQMVELMFLSSLCPTTWISVEKTSSLLSRISASTDNALSCECRGLEHSREACLHLAKTLSRLMVPEWGTVARGTQNFDTKLQMLINAVGGDSPQNIARFVERIKQIYQGQVFLLPQLGIKSQRLKERLDQQVSAGKWRDVARDLVLIEKVRVEDMVELVEELYGLMTHLAPHVAAAGLDNLLKELEVLHCSEIHRQLYCQLGISLLINMIAMDKFPEGARVVQAIGRTGVDVRTLKPFTVFELANLDENFTPIAVPLMMLDVYICSGYVELAVNLVAHWEYLETYPRPLQSGDQQRKFDIFGRILDKSLARNGENALPMRLRIYNILCSGDVSQMPLVRRNKMKQNGKNILVEMLNRNTKGGDLWTVVEELDRALYVVTGEVARGVLLRLVQAGRKEEATSLYRRTELTVTGTYEKQDTRADDLKLLLKSYYSFEELQIIIAEFFHELKKTLFIGEKNVSIVITEAEIPQSGIFLLKRVVTSKKEALNRVRQILAYMKPQMLVSMADIPFIPKDQVYQYIEESV